MKKVKVRVLLPFVSGKQSFGFGDETSLDQDVAYTFAKKGVVEFKTKKEFTELNNEIKEAEAERKVKEEQEAKREAALNHKDELVDERIKLQLRVDDITDALGDGADYYKSYTDLSDDLEKQGEGEE